MFTTPALYPIKPSKSVCASLALTLQLCGARGIRTARRGLPKDVKVRLYSKTLQIAFRMLLPCTAGLLFTALPVRADRIFVFAGAGSVPCAANIDQDEAIVARLFESIEAAGEDDCPGRALPGFL